MLRSAALLTLAVAATAFHAPPTAVTQSVATRGRAATTMGPFDFLAFGKAAASHILLDDGGRANFIKQVRRLSSARAASLSLSLLARVLSFSDRRACVYQEIESGKISFGAAAQQYSTCPSSSKGGDLGAFERGAMVPQFDDYCCESRPPRPAC